MCNHKKLRKWIHHSFPGGQGVLSPPPIADPGATHLITTTLVSEPFLGPSNMTHFCIIFFAARESSSHQLGLFKWTFRMWILLFTPGSRSFFGLRHCCVDISYLDVPVRQPNQQSITNGEESIAFRRRVGSGLGSKLTKTESVVGGGGLVCRYSVSRNAHGQFRSRIYSFFCSLAPAGQAITSGVANGKHGKGDT